MIISHKRLDNILFLDIETVPVVKTYSELSEEGKSLWDLKSQALMRFQAGGQLDQEPAEMFAKKAGIFAEFAKVVCISMGYLKLGSSCLLRLKSFCGDDEREVLESFTHLLDKHFDNPKRDYLCGHNIREFDIPFLCRRMMVHNIDFPVLLQISDKKPWQIEHLLDTMALWKFGDFKNYTSLRLLAYTLGIPSPKDDIDGSQVARVYYEEGDLPRIATYCEKDVETVARIVLKMTNYPIRDLVVEATDS